MGSAFQIAVPLRGQNQSPDPAPLRFTCSRNWQNRAFGENRSCVKLQKNFKMTYQGAPVNGGLTNCRPAPTCFSSRGEHSSPSSQCALICRDEDVSISSPPNRSTGEYSYPKSFEIASRFALECPVCLKGSDDGRAFSQLSASSISTAESSAGDRRRVHAVDAERGPTPNDIQDLPNQDLVCSPHKASSDDEVNSYSEDVSKIFSASQQERLAQLVRQVIDASNASLEILHNKQAASDCGLSDCFYDLRLRLLDAQIQKMEAHFKVGRH